MKITCAIFDADGTLLDSMPMWKAITYEYAQDRGLDAPPGLHRTLNRLSMEQCAAAYKELGAPGSLEEIRKELSQYALNGYRDRVKEKPHATALLKLLHENGVHVAVATASNPVGVRTALEANGMTPYVEYLVSCTEVGQGKDSPAVFLNCAEHFGAVPAECVVFEDSAYALRTARGAGFLTVGIRDEISAEEPGADCSQLCHRYLPDYAQLLAELTPPEEEGSLLRAVRK